MGKASVEDRLAINDLFVRYTTALDACDTEAVVDCFTADGVIDSPVQGLFQGSEGVRRFADITAKVKREHGGQFRHVLSNLRIDMGADGTRARAKCYLLDFLTRDGKTELLSPGDYDCELVKTGGEWKFAKRLVHMDKMFTT
jgi:ketosteroid isomerase-like protein